MMILNVTTNPKTHEVKYNNISEFDLFDKLNLTNYLLESNSNFSTYNALYNEICILDYFISQGFTHINDPHSSMNPYLIKDHINMINQYIKNQNF